MSAKTIRLTVADATGRHDLVVASDSTVSELLTVGGVDLRRYVGTTTSGAAIDLNAEVSVTPGDGGVIWLFDREEVAIASRARKARHRSSGGDRQFGQPLLIALLLLITASLIACAALIPTPVIISGSAAFLLVGALALLAQPVTTATLYVPFVAPLLAAAAGAVALAGFRDVGAMAAAGAVAAAAAACVRHAQARMTGEVHTATTAVIAVLWSVVAVLDAAAFIASVPATTVAALHIAFAVPTFHYVRAAAFDVNPDNLLDIPHVIRDAQGLRTATPTEPEDVDAAAAAHQYVLARRRSDAGIIVTCLIALLSALYLVPSTPAGTIEGWCVLGGTLGAGCYFLLTSRTLRSGLSRAATVIAGVALTVAAALALIVALKVSALVVALVLVLTGVLVGCLTVPLAKHWRSLGWSRTGDIIEGILLALAPAALLYGSRIAGQILEVFS